MTLDAGCAQLTVSQCVIDWAARSLHTLVDSLGSTWDHAEHAQRRRTLERGFSPAAMKDYEGIVNRRVVQLTEMLSARKSVDLARLFGCFSCVEIPSKDYSTC